MLLSSQLIRTRHISITTSSLILRILPVTGSSKTSFFHRLLFNGSATDYVWNMAYQLSNRGPIVTEKSARIIQDDLLTAMRSVKQSTGGLQGIRKILKNCFDSWRKKNIRSSEVRIRQSRERNRSGLSVSSLLEKDTDQTTLRRSSPVRWSGIQRSESGMRSPKRVWTCSSISKQNLPRARVPDMRDGRKSSM